MGKVIKHSEGAKSRLYGTFKANQQPRDHSKLVKRWGNDGLDSIGVHLFSSFQWKTCVQI